MLSLINSILLIFGDPRKSLFLGLIVGLIVGLLFGWFVMGWWVAPVVWTDAAPVDLSAKEGLGYQQMYLTLLAEWYYYNPQMAPQELQTYLGHGWDPIQAADLVKKIANEPGRAAHKDQLLELEAALRTLPTPAKPQAGLSGTTVCLAGVAALAIVLLLLVGVRTILPRLRGEAGLQPPTTKVAVPSTGAAAGKVVAPEAWVGVTEKPISQFVTTYQIGDNRYDISFSIESGADFLGECGVAISETIGVGDPDKVTALEVWLFDKNDVRTVTKVLMSEHCFGDATLRAKLAPKGEAVLITPDGSFDLDTQTLKLRAHVVELDYGTGGLPPRSFFNKVTLELAAWPKTA